MDRDRVIDVCSKGAAGAGSILDGSDRLRDVADEASAEELEPGALGVANMAARRSLCPVGIALGDRLHDRLVLGMCRRKPVRHSQRRAAKQDHRVAQ